MDCTILPATETMSTTALLSLCPPGLAPILAAAIASEASLERAAKMHGGANFGIGRAWGNLAFGPKGVAIYRQFDGKRVTVTWDAVREIRAGSTPAEIAELEAAAVFAKASPRYREPRLPEHLLPERRDPAMPDDEWKAAVSAEGQRWSTEVYQPFLEHSRQAEERLSAALSAVLAESEPTDLLGFLDEMMRGVA